MSCDHFFNLFLTHNIYLGFKTCNKVTQLFCLRQIFICKSLKFVLYALKNFNNLKRNSRLVVDFKANCPLVGPGPIGGMPSVGGFLRDPSPYLHEFRENYGKLQTARSTSTTKV